ncbi:MAG: 23S rRNA (uracil(1939)-C(5))-methyltransferase RlmD [Fusobacteriaceae bacterium]
MGNIIEIKIEKIIYGGEGLGYLNDFAIFVPMSIPGDKVQCEIISLKKNYGRGIIKKILEPSEERIFKDGVKISFEDFHGCDFAMMNYESQLKYKKIMVEDVLKKIGKLENFELPEILSAENQKNYRNKVIEPFSFCDGKIITGFFKKKSHEIFEAENNFLNSELGNKIIVEAKNILNTLDNKISVYDEKLHKGILRHIMVRTNSKNDAMIVLIINGNPNNSAVTNFLKSLAEKFSEIKSVYISVNREKTNFALGKENILVAGEKIISENLFGIEFNISPTSFFQINIEQTKKLYEVAISFAENIENKNVVDAYSGTGTIGMILSKSAKKVFAIEISRSAVEDGQQTASENKISNIEFINGSVESELPKLLQREKIDTVFLDPPRKGVEESSLKKIIDTGIKEIIYISCNPSTFARDVEFFSRFGYTLKKIKCVDMFPQTSHIECVGKIIKS